jgi:glutamate-1-semialdehyde aminotransferase
MEPAARMFISSTYWSDTIGLRAALTTFREVRKRNVPDYLHELGAELQRELNRIAGEVSAPIRCEGLAVHPQLVFDTDDPELQRRLATLYIQEMAKRGCHGYPSFYLNAAQGPREVEQTLTAVRETFSIIAEALSSGTIDESLEADLREDAFRRLVT